MALLFAARRRKHNNTRWTQVAAPLEAPQQRALLIHHSSVPMWLETGKKKSKQRSFCQANSRETERRTIWSSLREFKKLRRQLQGKRHIKIELCVKLSLLRLFHVYRVVQNRRSALSLSLLGTNGFHVKAKNERFTAASSRRQNLKYKNFTPSFGRLRQNIAPKSVPHLQHDYFSSFNQLNHWFVALPLTLPSSNLKLPNNGSTKEVYRPFDVCLTSAIFVKRRSPSAVFWLAGASRATDVVQFPISLPRDLLTSRL